MINDAFSRELPLLTRSTPCPDSHVRPVRRVQLFFPPMVFPRFQSRQTALFPLGIGYIAAVLEQHDYEVSLVDCPSAGYDQVVSIGKDRSVYGLSQSQIRDHIERFRPDAVGISCLFSTLERQTLKIAQLVKSISPETVVIVGGPHIAGYYRRVIQNPAVDYCVIGEGEETIIQLLTALNAGRVPADADGLCYRSQGQVRVQPRTRYIENLDQVPFPARHLVDQETYFRIGKTQGLRLDGEARQRVVQLTTSRGCPFQCKYCAKDVSWGTSFRTRSAADVLNEMEHCIEKYGATRFAFQDDNLTADMDRAAEIFDGMVERRLGVTWEAHNGLGVNFLSPALLEKMRASGCVSFTIAVESANATTLLRVRKPIYISLAPPIVKKAKELGMEVRGFFMIGFPGETLPEVQKTIAYARSLELAVSAFAIVTPLPGTVLFNECVEQGLIDEATVDFEDLSFGAFDVQLSQVPIEQLKVIRKIEWLKTVLLDPDGELKANVALDPRDAREELENGLRLFPNEPELRRIFAAAAQRYGWEASLSA